MIYNPYTPQHPDRAEEWVESAENEPDELWGCGGCGSRWPLSALRERGCPDCHANYEWGRTLTEEEDEQC